MQQTQLKTPAYHLKPTLHVGKAGVTETILNEIKVQLKKRKLVKIKLLKSAKDTNFKATAQHIAEKVGAKLVKQIGGTVTLYEMDKHSSD